MSLKLLKAPEYSEEERDYVVDFLMALKKPLIVEFFKEEKITPAYGNKKTLRERLTKAIEDAEIDYSVIVDYIDRLMPWGKQHIYLYDSPGLSDKWTDGAWVEERLVGAGVKKYFNARRRIVLPKALTLCSIEHSSKRLTITAVQRREYTERDKSRDYAEQVEAEGHGDDDDDVEGGVDRVEYRAYLRHVDRGWVRFEWNLTADTSMLQIGQLGQDSDYEEVRKEFFEMVSGWLDLSRFPLLDLRRAISNLHRRVEEDDREVQFVMADYKTLGGRRLAGYRPTDNSADELFGSEAVIDDAMSKMRKEGVGNKANVYWLPKSDYPNKGQNELEDAVHVHVVGSDNRLSVPIPQPEDAIRYVLRRVRVASQ